MEASADDGRQQIDNSPACEALAHSHQQGGRNAHQQDNSSAACFPATKPEQPRVVAGPDVMQLAQPMTPMYNHPNNYMHTQPMYGAPPQNNAMNCFHHCQHRCPRSMNPLNNMAYGNISINAPDLTKSNIVNQMPPQHAEVPHQRPPEPCYHYHGSPTYTPTYEPTQHNKSPLIMPAPMHSHELPTASVEQHQQAAVADTAKTNIDNNAQEEKAQVCENEQAGDHQHRHPDHQHKEENAENENETHVHRCHHEQEQREIESQQVQEQYYEESPYEVKNKREISKGLTDDSAKSLIYFQHNEGFKTVTEKNPHSKHYRYSGEIPQSSPNTKIETAGIKSSKHHVRKSDDCPPEGPRKDIKNTVTYGEDTVIPQSNQAAESEEVAMGTGDATHESELSQQLEESCSLKGGSKLKHYSCPPHIRAEFKRRNGLE